MKKSNKILRGVCVGAGYFSRFHYEAWSRIPEVDIIGICDLDTRKAQEATLPFFKNTPPQYSANFEALLKAQKPDFVDIITPPETHFDYCKIAADLGVDIIVQKPLAPTQQEAMDLVAYCHDKGVRLMVHENFRFQPWHREIKQLIDNQAIGEFFNFNFRMRMGDGWQPDAYLARQPYFRTMPQLLIYETGVHFIDTFRYLAGDIESVYAQLKKRNPDIAGEDAGMVFFNFTSGANGLYDANRYNESNAENARYTFGEFLVEGSKGSIRLFNDGKITLQPLGEKEKEHIYNPAKANFAGDCVYATQRHFVECLSENKPFETSGDDYLKNIQVQEAVYLSAKENRVVSVI